MKTTDAGHRQNSTEELVSANSAGDLTQQSSPLLRADLAKLVAATETFDQRETLRNAAAVSRAADSVVAMFVLDTIVRGEPSKGVATAVKSAIQTAHSAMNHARLKDERPRARLTSTLKKFETLSS